MTTKIVNLTGHDLKLTDRNSIVSLRYDGRARVISKSEIVARIYVDNLSDPLPLTKLTNQEIVNLPEPTDGTLYVVSGIVAAYTNRMDVVAPGRIYRDSSSGRIIGCMGFVKAMKE